MTSHLGIMILFAACVSIVFGTLLKDDARGQQTLALKIFGGLVLGALAVGWIMYWGFA